MKWMRIFLAAIVASMGGVELRADQRPNQSSPAPEQVTVAAQGPQPLTIPTWIAPPPKTFGIFTLAQPEQPGEIFRVSVPVGALVMRAAHAIGQARYRQAEAKARKEVEQALNKFLASQR
jgi:hypothetical protein